ncbi:MAG: hypothetical protein RLY86_2813 [Pseudomonadota bacterium]|jgi:isocitrate dehydrogenase
MKTHAITVARGDGIGPEIMAACLRVLHASGARLAVEEVEIGEKVYLSGVSSGISPAAWDSLRRTKVFYKAPITTPQGGGYKSLNVTIRKTLGLYANVRPCASLYPLVDTKHPKMDLVIIRENEEDLYAGIEHRQTEDVYQCLKLITRPGCERIVRYAFEYARANGRRKVSCFSKDNIMKLTDGLFHRVFDEIGAEYPEIGKDHWIVDIGAARLADTPEIFDVVVMPNLYGDILSDVAAQITGSVGLGGSSNIGEHVAMFEAIHGSAPDIAGKDMANPSGLLLAGVMMLTHLGELEAAAKVHNAWLCALEDGAFTRDLARGTKVHDAVGTQAFADAVIARLGKRPTVFKASPITAGAAKPMSLAPPKPRGRSVKTSVGLDLFVGWAGSCANDLATMLKPAEASGMALQMITNRGVKVWPEQAPETFTVDHWRCRFMASEGTAMTNDMHLALLRLALENGIDVIKTETLCTFDGKPGYSLGQGQ